MNPQRLPLIRWAGKHHASPRFFNQIFSERWRQWHVVSGQGIPPSASDCHSTIDFRRMNLTLSQSKSPYLDWSTCLPVIVLSFKPQALLTGFYPLPLGETRKKKKNKSKEKRKRKHTEQTLLSLFTFCWGYRPSSFLYLLQSSIHFHALPFYLLKNKERDKERKIFII